MQAFRHVPRRLTKLYSDTKHSCDVVTEQERVVNAPEFGALHRKFRIQKDRLIAWGLDWSDDTANAQGSIDESLARAGLTEAVTSVLNTIKELLYEAEEICNAGRASTLVSEKSGISVPTDRSWDSADSSRYEDLLRDLTTSIDTLYDISRSRRAVNLGLYPHSSSKKPSPYQPIAPPAKSIFLAENYSASEETLVNLSRRSTIKSTPSLDSPPKLDISDLILPEEEPPPYDGLGITTSSRLIGHLRRASSSADPEKNIATVPVLVEYASYDTIYRDAEASPPTNHLERLLDYFGRCKLSSDSTGSGILDCLGYFEDTKQPRYGLVYQLPSSIYSGSADAYKREELKPVTLLHALQAASKALGVSSVASTAVVPALEVRFRLAHEITKAFSRFHEQGLVHADVNSGNILLFRNSRLQASDKVAEQDLRHPYLCSFDVFFDSYGKFGSHMSSSDMYRHPEDPHVNDGASGSYRQQFDMYGLGLILLEIGLWIPLASIFKPKYTLSDFKARLQDIWVKRLAAKCGTLFMQIVRECLSAANQNTQSTTPLYDWILSRLQRCCLLNEEVPVRTDIILPSLATRFAAHHDDRKRAHPPSPIDQHVSQHGFSVADQPAKAQSSTSSDKPKSPTIIPLPPNLALISRPITSRYKPRPGLLERHTVPFATKEVSEESPPQQNPDEDNTLELKQSHETSHSLQNKHRKDEDNISTTSITSKYKAAANVIARAWHARCEKLTFKEYRRKVTVIQNCWRERQERRQSSRTSASQRSAPNSPTPYRQAEREVQIEETISDQTSFYTRLQEAPPRPKLRLHPVKISKSMLDEWHQVMLPRLERIVERTLKDSPETVSIDLVGVGETAATAIPTIFVTCSSTGRVKAALARKFIFDPTTFDLRIRKGKVRRSKVTTSKKRRPPPHRAMLNESTSDGDPRPALNPYHQQRPLCGASIGAFTGKHLPPVSYGGVVLVDGEPYGMSVHHLLDAPSEDDDSDYGEEDTTAGAERSSARPSGYPWLAEMGSQPSLQIPTEDLYDLEISDDDEEEPDGTESAYDSLDDPLADSDSDAEPSPSHTSTEGDLAGVPPGEGVNILITQPALDDVDASFFPSADDRDDEHLFSHKLGHVHASSGIRRWTRDGLVHEIDWALLRLEPERLQPYNLVQGGRRFCRSGDGRAAPRLCPKLLEPVCRQDFDPEEDEYPSQVAPCDELGNLKVHCFGRTSGLQGGRISPAMSSVRIYRRRSMSRSWHVVGGFGMGGDSGAWVIDNDQGRVCGHVLAWCAKNLLAYICPMEVLLDDIKRTLQAKQICLPGEEEEVVHSDAEGEYTHANGVLRVEETGTLPSFGGLRIDSPQSDVPRSRRGVGGMPLGLEYARAMRRDSGQLA